MRSPLIFETVSVQISRFSTEIYDFEQFSWAPVHDFSKNTLLLERYLCIFSIFQCFSRFDHVLEHCLLCFGISLMLFWWFFNFWTSFADFGWIWSKIQHCFDAFSKYVCVFYYANLMIFSGNLRFWIHFVDVFYMVNTLRIGPPRGGHDRRDLASAEGILSDPKFNTVLMRSPNVYGIFTVQISRFFAESFDFE